MRKLGFVVLLCGVIGTAQAEAVTHHGGPILHCDPPQFFDEKPVAESSVAAVDEFTLFASDNTDPSTVQVWVNNTKIPAHIEQQKSGRWLIKGKLVAPLTSGRAWFKVTGNSHDGCDELRVWNIYIR
jgi:hypothetical protein